MAHDSLIFKGIAIDRSIIAGAQRLGGLWGWYSRETLTAMRSIIELIGGRLNVRTTLEVSITCAALVTSSILERLV